MFKLDEDQMEGEPTAADSWMAIKDDTEEEKLDPKDFLNITNEEAKVLTSPDINFDELGLKVETKYLKYLVQR